VRREEEEGGGGVGRREVLVSIMGFFLWY